MKHSETKPLRAVPLQRLVRRFGLHYVAHLAGRSSIGTTEEAAIEGLVECLHPYWIAYCPECDWLDSSENAAGGKPTGGGDDYTDAICPKCCADPNDPECVGKNVVIEEFSLPNTTTQVGP